jgi:hypothetical protein
VGERQKQIPCGNDRKKCKSNRKGNRKGNGKGNGKGKVRGNNDKGENY